MIFFVFFVIDADLDIVQLWNKGHEIPNINTIWLHLFFAGTPLFCTIGTWFMEASYARFSHYKAAYVIHILHTEYTVYTYSSYYTYSSVWPWAMCMFIRWEQRKQLLSSSMHRCFGNIWIMFDEWSTTMILLQIKACICDQLSKNIL